MRAEFRTLLTTFPVRLLAPHWQLTEASEREKVETNECIGDTLQSRDRFRQETNR